MFKPVFCRRRLWGSLFASLALVTALGHSAAALADGLGVGSNDTAIQAAPLVAIITPYVQLIIQGMIPIVIAVLGYQFTRMTGIPIAAANQQAIVQAAQSAAAGVIARGAADVANKSFDIGNPEIATATRIATGLAQKAITATGMTPDHVAAIVLGEVGKLQLSSSAPAAPSTPPKAA